MNNGKPLKIAFFVTEFPALSETFIINQVIGLKQSGHTVHIFSETRPSSPSVHQVVTDYKLLDHTFYLDIIPASRTKKILSLGKRAAANFLRKNFFLLIKAAFKNKSRLSVYDFIPFIDKPEYDVVHAHFGINGNYVTQLRKLGLYARAKFITTFHGYDLNSVYKKNNFYKDLFLECNTFTVNTRYSKNRLLNLQCDEGKIHLLPVGLNISFFKRKPVVSDVDKTIRLLFVGRLIRLKGPQVFVEICKRLKDRNVIQFSAVMIGDGILMKEIGDLVAQNDLRDRIELAGALTQSEVLDCMNNADIFILPGLTVEGLAEAQGLVIQEAQAMQLPVIVSDAGGMKEGIIENVSGFVLSENKVDDFVKKIEELVTNAELRKKMGASGRKFVEDNYDIAPLNEKLLQLYLN